uniref:Uncharacterized protein n=1 Tax=Rhizophora mucronata TaxID=61149 RepID=A0A2P2L255_RHIMU
MVNTPNFFFLYFCHTLQFLEWIDEGAKCPYCEGLGYIVCDVCEGKSMT